MTATVQLKDLCESKGVTIQAVLVRRPLNWDAKGDADWKDSAFQWRVTLEYQGRKLSTDYWTGCGNTVTKFNRLVRTTDDQFLRARHRADAKPIQPTAADVLNSLCLDASAMDESFDDWCIDLGMNNDSIKAKTTYFECQRLGKEVRKLCGADFDAFRNAEH